MTEIRLELKQVLTREPIPTWLKIGGVLLGIVLFPISIAVFCIMALTWLIAKIRKTTPTPPEAIREEKISLDFASFEGDPALNKSWAEATWEGHSQLYQLKSDRKIIGLDDLTTSGFYRRVSQGILIQMVTFEAASQANAHLFLIDPQTATAKKVLRTGPYYLYNDPEDPEAITGLSPGGEIRIEVFEPEQAEPKSSAPSTP